MRRSLKILIGFSLIITIWLLGIDETQISSINKLVFPVIAITILAIISLANILWRVYKLEDHPNERT
jgi:hypothetical protein